MTATDCARLASPVRGQRGRRSMGDELGYEDEGEMEAEKEKKEMNIALRVNPLSSVEGR